MLTNDILKLCLGLLFFRLTISTSDEDPVVYWRPFIEKVPPDVFVADNTSNPVRYIARASFSDKHYLHPGSLSDGLNYMDFDAKPKECLEVLCTSRPENLVWVKTTNKEVAKLSDLVTGGYYFDDFSIIYIAKKLFSKTLLFSGVTPRENYTFPYIYGYDSDTNKADDDFEVLVYRKNGNGSTN